VTESNKSIQTLIRLVNFSLLKRFFFSKVSAHLFSTFSENCIQRHKLTKIAMHGVTMGAQFSLLLQVNHWMW